MGHNGFLHIVRVMVRTEREAENRKRMSMGTRSGGAGEMRPGAQAGGPVGGYFPSSRGSQLEVNYSGRIARETEG